MYLRGTTGEREVMVNHDELEYLIEQLNWFKEEARKYAERIALLAEQMKEDASRARLEWAQDEAQRYIRLTEDLAGRLHQVTSRLYWKD